MDGYGLLLKALVLSLVSSIFSFSFFWDMATPLFSFLSFSLFFWVMLLRHVIFSLFGATWSNILFYFTNVLRERVCWWCRFLVQECSKWMVTCMCLWSRKQEKDLTRVTQFDKTQQNIKQHMCKVFLWNKTYGSGRTCLSLRNLPFQLFENKRLQISSITRTSLYSFIYHIYIHNNLDSDQPYATHIIFKFIGKVFTWPTN